MAAQWFTVGSDKFDSASHEGQVGHLIQEALDGTDFWYINITEIHWFIIDLGRPYTLTKIRGRSRYEEWDPIDIDVYVSNDKENFGAAVATGISSWHDTTSFIEVALTPKNGRYVKLVVNCTDKGCPGRMCWGNWSPAQTITELFGEVVVNPYPTSRLRKDVIHGYNCFVSAYVAAKIGGFDPLKLPDGTLF